MTDVKDIRLTRKQVKMLKNTKAGAIKWKDPNMGKLEYYDLVHRSGENFFRTPRGEQFLAHHRQELWYNFRLWLAVAISLLALAVSILK